MRKLELFAQFGEDELSVIGDHNLNVLSLDDPVRQLLSLELRPGIRDNEDEAVGVRRARAYQVGVLIGAALVRRWATIKDTDVPSPVMAGDAEMQTIRELSQGGRERFSVTQFIEGEHDVQLSLRDIAEHAWLEQRVTFLNGHEWEQGHNDYVQVGVGDVLAVYALRDCVQSDAEAIFTTSAMAGMVAGS